MSKETYLQLKKEFWMRLAFNVGIAGIGLVLLIVMIFNQSRYIPSVSYTHLDVYKRQT